MAGTPWRSNLEIGRADRHGVDLHQHLGRPPAAAPACRRGRSRPGPPSTQAFIRSGIRNLFVRRCCAGIVRVPWVIARPWVIEMRGIQRASGSATSGETMRNRRNRSARRVGLYRPLRRQTARRPRRGRSPSAAATPRKRSSSPMGDVGQIVPLNVAIGDESAAACLPRRQRHAGQLRRDPARKRVADLRAGAPYRARPARRLCSGGRGRALRPHFGDRRRSALDLGLRPAPRRPASGRCATPFRPSTILRPSVVFGPEDQFFNRFAAMAMISPVLPLIGGGETRFQPVYVGDVADAVIKCLEDPATAGTPTSSAVPKCTLLPRAPRSCLLGEIRRKRWLVDIPFGARRPPGAADVDPS